MGGHIRTMAAEGEVSAKAVAGPTGVELSGKRAAELVFMEAGGSSSIGIYPSRWIDSLCCSTSVGNWKRAEGICKAVKENDYGIALGGRLGGVVGFADSYEAEAKLDGEKSKFTIGSKMANGFGYEVKYSIMLVHSRK